MTKRKRGTGAKPGSEPKIAKTRRATKAVVEGPKDSLPRAEAAGSTEPPPEHHDEPRPVSTLVESPATALHDDLKQTEREHASDEALAFASADKSPEDTLLHAEAAGSTELLPERLDDSKPEAPLVESPATASRGDREQTMRESASRKTFAFPSATENVRACQAKLLEMAQADVRFAFEFAERLATMKSPAELPRVMAEFADKRIATLMDHSKELVELSTGRRPT
jgi:hypothetical protein